MQLESSLRAALLLQQGKLRTHRAVPHVLCPLICPVPPFDPTSGSWGGFQEAGRLYGPAEPGGGQPAGKLCSSEATVTRSRWPSGKRDLHVRHSY